MVRIKILFFRLVPNFLLRRLLPYFNEFSFLNETKNTQTPITFDMWYSQNVQGRYKSVHWPVHSTSTVIGAENIYCGIETCPGYSPGNYIQALGKVYIGDYTQIGPNVGIISSNHSLEDNSIHHYNEVVIGKYSWIGMGAIILPGVTLGEYTIVAAGSVVTKKFPEGYQVLAGNPAKIIKKLDKDKCVLHKSKYEYHGYLSSKQFSIIKKSYDNDN